MKLIVRISFVAITIMIGACSTNRTGMEREESARPRVEQRALSDAIDVAFRNVDLSPVIGKRVYVSTHALSKIDIAFIEGYVGGLIMEKGGVISSDEHSANIKLYNVIKVSGTDDIHRKLLADKVRGEYRSTLSVIDVGTGRILATYELTGVSDEKR